MLSIYALLDPGEVTSGEADGHRLARHTVELDGTGVGTLSFLQTSDGELLTPSAGADLVQLGEGCVAKLLANAVSELDSRVEPCDPADEPELVAPHGGKRSAGIVLVDERGWLTIREPANHFAGYQHSYAKGRVDKGETPRQTARRELAEETGLTGRIVGVIGDFAGQTGLTRFYVGVRTGGEEKPSAETWAVKTVSPFTAMELLNVQRDKDVLVRLIELAAGVVEWPWTLDSRRVRCRLVDGRIVCIANAGDGRQRDQTRRMRGHSDQVGARRSTQLILSERFERALQFAAATHRSQVRKGSGIPYIGHLLGVCSLVIEDGGDEDEAIAALLHDAAEDQGGEAMLAEIRTLFGDHVAGIVAACSDTFQTPKPPWDERKQTYIDHLDGQPEPVLRVSLADKLFNARAILRDYLLVGDEVWSRFQAGRGGQIWYYSQLADRFTELLPGRMAVELVEVVDELKRVTGAPSERERQ